MFCQPAYNDSQLVPETLGRHLLTKYTQVQGSQGISPKHANRVQHSRGLQTSGEVTRARLGLGTLGNTTGKHRGEYVYTQRQGEAHQGGAVANCQIFAKVHIQ